MNSHRHTHTKSPAVKGPKTRVKVNPMVKVNRMVKVNITVKVKVPVIIATHTWPRGM